MDTFSQGSGNTRKSSAIRNLQPRAAAAIDFNDSDDDDGSGHGLLSADYKAQRSTTMDLVDFFNNAPPPHTPTPMTVLPPILADEKKKRTLLQRLKSRKSSLSMMGGSGGRDRASATAQPLSQGSANSSMSGTSHAGSEVATLPNGKKYIMIAVDYQTKDTQGTGLGATGNTVSGALNSGTSAGGIGIGAGTGVRLPPVLGSPKRLSFINSYAGEGGESMHDSILNNNPNVQFTTTIDDHSGGGHNNNDGNNNTNHVFSNRSSTGADKRRSITIQGGGGEGSAFILDGTPFLLDNFALDTDYITPTSGQLKSNTANDRAQRKPHAPNNAAKTQQQTENTAKKGTKVTFSIASSNTQQQQPSAMSEDAVSKALADRIANHKSQVARGLLPEDLTSLESAQLEKPRGATTTAPPEVDLPKPMSRKRVRHVQIQTQHCIMRPMYTQTERFGGSFDQDQHLEVKEFSTQTESRTASPSRHISNGATTDMATSTDSESTLISPTKTNSKVTSMVSSLSHHSTPSSANTTTNKDSTSTSTNTTTTTTPTSTKIGCGLSDEEELVHLRRQNAALQAQVVTLQRDLAAETRARTRTAVAMQDTRDKFEMLSAMAYKKLKEMIFQRHVLEMEVRELRAQVDMHNEVNDLQRQEYITVGLQ
ncbi:hypothetical protein EDD11_002370 [Mortierella claussenii]|nr:hypothetical protein EDD11_002370 [Mortierella claussenii]